MLERRGVQVEGGHRGKKWDNCNNIINKIYKKRKHHAKWKKPVPKDHIALFYLHVTCGNVSKATETERLVVSRGCERRGTGD